MTDELFYPGGPSLLPPTVADPPYLSTFNTYAYFYRYRLAGSDWGPEFSYTAGMNLGLSNLTPVAQTYEIEFITRTYRNGVEVPPPTVRSQTFVLEPRYAAQLDSITITPTGPIASGNFVIKGCVGYPYGVFPVVVTGTYQLKKGVVVITGGTLVMTQTGANEWTSDPVTLPIWTNPTPDARDVKIDLLMVPDVGYEYVPDSNLSALFPSYWSATVVIPPVPEGDVFEEIMSNFNHAWMNQDRLPGVRHSIKPVAPDTSADDLYIIDIVPRTEITPAKVLYESGVISPGSGWTYDTYAELGYIDIDLSAFTGNILGVVLTFDNPTGPAPYYTVQLDSPFSSDSLVFYPPASVDWSSSAFNATSITGMWKLSFTDYVFSNGALVPTNINLKILGE